MMLEDLTQDRMGGQEDEPTAHMRDHRVEPTDADSLQTEPAHNPAQQRGGLHGSHSDNDSAPS